MTSDERVEIAARLRKAHGIMAFVEALGIDLDSDWCWTDVSKRVAELIDPTCNVVTSGEWRGLEIGGRCSACHAPLACGVRYCDNCGARVVPNDQ